MIYYRAYIKHTSFSEKEILCDNLNLEEVYIILQFSDVTGFIVRIETYWEEVEPI